MHAKGFSSFVMALRPAFLTLRYTVWLLLCIAALACGSEPEEEAPAGPSFGGWTPGTALQAPREAGPRGLWDRRGIIHAHTVYSHDACDGEPVDEATGAINEQCYEDFRHGLCTTRHDFVMLTDHDDLFAAHEFPDVLLYRQDRGDSLIEHNGAPAASWLACPDGDPALVMAGTETGTMPVGLERHVADTVAEREQLYGEVSADAIAAFKDAGAVALVQHTEDWSVEQLTELPLDGFEMYNLHANTIIGMGGALQLIADLQTEPELLPHPDLILLAIVKEDERYLERWGGALAAGAVRVTTMATDCHRNTFSSLLPDGERIDGYRRMMSWFSNHLLLLPEQSADGSFDDQDLKDALRAGRLYGSFDVFGYPEGFDFYALEGSSQVHEMGAQVSLAAGVELSAKLPWVRDLDPANTPPEVVIRLLRAQPDGWEVVTEAAEDLAHTVSETGAYRVEVRLRPLHLRPYLSGYAHLADEDFVWIYTNPIYVLD